MSAYPKQVCLEYKCIRSRVNVRLFVRSWPRCVQNGEKRVLLLIRLYLIAERAGEQPTASSFGAVGLRAPESILRSDFGTAIDIWAVGCIVRLLLSLIFRF